MQAETSGNVAGIVRLWSRPRRRQQTLALVAGVAIVAVLSGILILRGGASVAEDFRALGYPGLFLLTLIGSASVIIPVPGLLGVCGAGGLELNLIAVGLISGVGEAIGEMSGYAIGYGGRAVIERRPFYRRLSKWMRRRGTLVLFLVSLIPNPFFDVIGIVAGSTRFPLGRFILAVWAGKTIKDTAVAYACLQGVALLPWSL